MSELTIRPMTPADFDAWQRLLAEGFAQDKVDAGSWSADEALDLALAANAELLPGGLATDGMLIFTALVGDDPAGTLWIGLTHPRGVPDCAWIYDIEIDAAHRGKGYGRALLRAAEDVVRSHGVGHLELNVFGHNAAANGLYESAGYETVTRQMRKPLT